MSVFVTTWTLAGYKGPVISGMVFPSVHPEVAGAVTTSYCPDSYVIITESDGRGGPPARVKTML
jgi:hypothetical protein